jgi:hypothetical protein
VAITAYDEANGRSWPAQDHGRVGHDSLSASYLTPLARRQRGHEPMTRPTAERGRAQDHGRVGHDSRGQRRIVAVTTAYDEAAIDLFWRHHWPRRWPMVWPDDANGGSRPARDHGRVGHDSLSVSYLAPQADGSPGDAIGLVVGQWRGQTRPTADRTCGRVNTVCNSSVDSKRWLHQSPPPLPFLSKWVEDAWERLATQKQLQSTLLLD